MTERHYTIDRNYYGPGYYAGHLQRLAKNDRFTRVKASRVEALLRPRSGEAIVDLGCGVGTMMLMLSGSGVRMFGIDYSRESLRFAKERIAARKDPNLLFRCVCCEGRALAVRDESIDGIMAVDFTEHLDDTMLVPTFAEVHRILKPGGRLVVYTPNRTHLFELLKKRNIILKEDKSHIGLRTMKEYCVLLTAAGFVIKESYFRPTDIPLFSMLETIIMRIPLIGCLAKRRICIRGEK